MIVLIAVGVCGIVVGISYCFFNLKRRWKKLFAYNATTFDDGVIKRLVSGEKFTNNR